MARNPVGRPRRFAEFDRFYADLPEAMDKRPKYFQGIGVFRGARGDTAWIKIRLPRGGVYKGKTLAPHSSLEIKAGKLTSWDWQRLVYFRDEMQGRADRAEPLEDAPLVSFGDCAAEWLQQAKTTHAAYETSEIHVRCHLLPKFKDKPVQHISVADVNNWIAEKLKGCAPGTVRRQFNTFRSIMSDAVRRDLIQNNPCSKANPIRGITARQNFLNGQEIVSLLSFAENEAEWLPDFILWALHSGMRKGEILSLKWSSIRDMGHGQVITLVETSKSDEPRMVSCTNTMREVLDRQVERQVEGNDCVFPIAKMTLRRRWEAARQAAGLEHITIHDLRRTHSTHAAASGVDLRTLAARIGHTDLTMLQKHYAALVGDNAVAAANTVQSAFDRLLDKE